MDEIRTKELVIVDDHGRDRGCWNPNSIQIVGKELKRMLQMRAYSINQHQLDDGSHFSVGDQFIRHRQITALRTNWGIGSFDFRTAAEIETWKAEGRGEFIKQGTYMNLYDERGLPRVSLRAKITGSGLTVKDDFGKTKWEAP